MPGIRFMPGILIHKMERRTSSPDVNHTSFTEN
jgi:hypothetical protein